MTSFHEETLQKQEALAKEVERLAQKQYATSNMSKALKMLHSANVWVQSVPPVESGIFCNARDAGYMQIEAGERKA